MSDTQKGIRIRLKEFPGIRPVEDLQGNPVYCGTLEHVRGEGWSLVIGEKDFEEAKG